MLKILKLSLKDLSSGTITRYMGSDKVEMAREILSHCGVTFHHTNQGVLTAIEYPATVQEIQYQIGFVDKYDAIFIPVFTDTINNSKNHGEYFGYPKCCIDYVENRTESQKVLDFDIKDDMSETGFIPCPVCRTSKTTEQLTAEIKQNRKCPTDFPNGEMAGNLNFVHYLFDTYVKGDSK